MKFIVLLILSATFSFSAHSVQNVDTIKIRKPAPEPSGGDSGATGPCPVGVCPPGMVGAMANGVCHCFTPKTVKPSTTKYRRN